MSGCDEMVRDLCRLGGGSYSRETEQGVAGWFGIRNMGVSVRDSNNTPSASKILAKNGLPRTKLKSYRISRVKILIIHKNYCSFNGVETKNLNFSNFNHL